MSDTDNKPTAQGSAQPASKPQSQTPSAKKTEFNGMPVTNNLPPVGGKFMPSFKIEGDITPNIGDKITIKWGKNTRIGIVNRILDSNIVAITTAK